MSGQLPAQDLFHFETDRQSFESFKKAVNKAMAGCATLNISIIDNFIQDTRVIDGKTVEDFKLSKFACYLTVMNGDVSKSQVAKAQMYFATLADAVQRYIQESEDVERVLIRDEIGRAHV